MTSNFIKDQLARLSGIFIPEFTFGDLRIDAIIIDIPHRWIRGFEIKTNKNDFKSDTKWEFYTSFCSSLSIVCPENLLSVDMVPKPYGLLWVTPAGLFLWKRKPKKFQYRKGLAWLWTYLRVLEQELPRLVWELGEKTN